jgi:lysophospholipase L1-like esterase
VSTSSNLTDAAGNTVSATSNTNVAVTNNSAVVAATFNLVTDASSFEINGNFYTNFTYNGFPCSRSDQGVVWANTVDNYVYEFVCDATDVDLEGYLGGGATVSVDGGAGTVIGGPANAGYLRIASGMAAGRHLIRVTPGVTPFTNGFRLTGGNRTMHAVPTAKATAVTNGVTPGYLSATTPVKVWGVNSPLTTGVASSGAYSSQRLQFQVTATGAEVATIAGVAGQWAASVDGAAAGALIAAGDPAVSNTNDYILLASGLSAATHTVDAMCVATPTSNSGSKGIRAINGTKLASASSAAATTVSVSSTTYLAVNDWVKIGHYGTRECRQVTAISGTGPYTLTLNAALTLAHAVGEAVTSYSAAAGTISSWFTDFSAKRIVGMGDSNTHGANPYGLGGVTGYSNPAPDGNSYAPYDDRQSYLYKLGVLLGADHVNLGVQGTDTINQAGRAADINTYSQSSFDYCLIFEGTNDTNNNTTTQAQVQTNITTQVTTALTGLKAGGKILLVPPGTPQGTTSAKGLNIAGVATAMQAAIAANPSWGTRVVFAPNVLSGLNLTQYGTGNLTGDLYGNLHYMPSGTTTLANNAATLYINVSSGSPAPLLASFGSGFGF